MSKNKKTTTHIAVVLDRSGSMNSCAEATVSGFDEFIQKQQKEEGDATVTVAQFDDEYDIVFAGKNVKDMVSIRDLYQPRGMTALLDAIGKTIHDEVAVISRMADKPDRVLCLIITDGHENCSKDYTADTIAKMVREQEAGNWEFVFLGANMDAIATAKSFGIKGASAANYNTANTRQAFNKMSDKAAMYRSASGQGLEALKSGDASMFDAEEQDELL